MNAPVTDAQHVSIDATAAYSHSYEHLEEELRLLDVLLAGAVGAFRRRMQGAPENAQPHLYVSHDEVDHLLNVDGSADLSASTDGEWRAQYERLREAVDQRVARSWDQGVPLMLPELVRRFGLTPFERQVVVLCLAPELRRKYDRIFAYLQDDITRKRPTVDLALSVRSDREREQWALRALLSETAPLRYAELAHVLDDAQSPSGSSALAQFLQLDARILQFLLGHSVLDPALEAVVQVHRAEQSIEALPVEAGLAQRLTALVRRAYREAADEGRADRESGDAPLVLHLYGACAKSRRGLALALAATCDRPVLCTDDLRLRAGGNPENRVRRLAREARLLQMPLYVGGTEGGTGDEGLDGRLLGQLEQAALVYGGVVFLGSAVPWESPLPFEGCSLYQVECPRPDVAQRAAAWKEGINRAGGKGETGSAVHDRLARRYHLTTAQIREAAARAAHEQTLTGNPLTFDALAAASRRQSAVTLGKLAAKVEPRAGWDDLILPGEPREQLRELCDQVRHGARVFEEWGFDRTLSYGKGVSALFSGPPGTGKTLAAEVLAGDLRLDLYKVDLSQVVSKYIGETEKNLSRVFEEAEHSNAILFFDEADALFGKRTDISDAHDRYANIETSYLLQRMEVYDGVVILASNLRENLDDAFQRRIRFVVEFPFPDAKQRLGIWQAHVPEEAPLAPDIDLELLADRIPVAGGNIKNIVLNAAFLAAANGRFIGMEHLLKGARREYAKIGKLWDEATITG